jgi:hypothetical protein
MKVKESSSTLPPISRTPLSKDSILSGKKSLIKFLK